jgi:hypothetical protein
MPIRPGTAWLLSYLPLSVSDIESAIASRAVYIVDSEEPETVARDIMGGIHVFTRLLVHNSLLLEVISFITVFFPLQSILAYCNDLSNSKRQSTASKDPEVSESAPRVGSIIQWAPVPWVLGVIHLAHKDRRPRKHPLSLINDKILWSASTSNMKHTLIYERPTVCCLRFVIPKSYLRSAPSTVLL